MFKNNVKSIRIKIIQKYHGEFVFKFKSISNELKYKNKDIEDIHYVSKFSVFI